MTYSELTQKYGDSLIERGPAGNSGILVALFYDRKEKETHVFYSDNGDIEFVVNPPIELALDCYAHPILYFNSVLTTGRVPVAA